MSLGYMKEKKAGARRMGKDRRKLDYWDRQGFDQNGHDYYT